MADITVTSPAQVGASSSNWLGTQLIARGSVAAATQSGKAAGGVGRTPLTCQVQTQNGSSPIAQGTVYTTGTSWWARFGPLANVNGSTAYRIVANGPSIRDDSSFTVNQLYFNSDLNIAFSGNTGTQFPLSFSVTGTYMSGSGYTVACYLLNGTTTVAVGTVQLDQPQPGQWTASFSLTSNQSNCSLVAEMLNSQPVESVSATWIDGVNVTGS
jgi:hypothetical protein